MNQSSNPFNADQSAADAQFSDGAQLPVNNPENRVEKTPNPSSATPITGQTTEQPAYSGEATFSSQPLSGQQNLEQNTAQPEKRSKRRIGLLITLVVVLVGALIGAFAANSFIKKRAEKNIAYDLAMEKGFEHPKVKIHDSWVLPSALRGSFNEISFTSSKVTIKKDGNPLVLTDIKIHAKGVRTTSDNKALAKHQEATCVLPMDSFMTAFKKGFASKDSGQTELNAEGRTIKASMQIPEVGTLKMDMLIEATQKDGQWGVTMKPKVTEVPAKVRGLLPTAPLEKEQFIPLNDETSLGKGGLKVTKVDNLDDGFRIYLAGDDVEISVD